VQRPNRRVASVVVAIVAMLGFVVFLGQIFAQEPGVEDPSMDAEMMGEGMEGVGRAPAGGPLEWSEQEMPEELTMTYDQFLADTGQPRALLPDLYLFDENDVPRKYTKNQWAQLQRVYATRREVVVGVPEARVGRPGVLLAERIANEMAAKENERRVMRELYEQGLSNFWFEIGYPQMRSQDITPGATAIPIEVGVIMHVKPSVAKRYPSLVYRRLKKFDNYGDDRVVFRIADYDGGVWNPKVLRLWNGSVSEWEGLWPQNVVRLTLYDVDGGRIVSGQQAAGLGGDICSKLLYPDELNYAPMHETIIPPRDYTFEGGKLNLDYKKGWYYNFSFTVPLAQLAGLDRAEAVLIGAEGIEGSRSATQAAPPPAVRQTGSQAAAQAGAQAATDTARTYLPMMRQQIAPGFY